MFNNTKKDAVDAVKSVNNDLREVASKAGRKVGVIAEDLNEDLREFATKAGAKARDVYHATNDELAQAADKVTTQIKNKPVQASLIALATGFVLGVILRRK